MCDKPQAAGLRRQDRWWARTLGVLGIVIGLMLGGVAFVRGGASPDATAADSPGGAEPGRVITMITGDRVTRFADGRVAVARGTGREQIRFTDFRLDDGRHYVLPEDARPLVVAGLLDRRLFDVTGLVAGGYDDLGTATIPLIIAAPDPGVTAEPALTGVEITKGFTTAGASSAKLAKPATATAWPAIKASGQRVWLDGKRTPLPNQTGPGPVGKPFGDEICAGANSCDESAILAGMESATGQAADVVAIGFGSRALPELDPAQVDPVQQAMNRLSETTGTLFVTPTRAWRDPAGANSALTVGDTAAGADLPEHETSVRQVAGAAAALAERHPDWAPGELKAALLGAATSKPAHTTGPIGLQQAITQPVIVARPDLSFGTQPWPHQDDAPVAEELTYRNVGDEAIELTLTSELSGPDGRQAPAGAVRLSTDKLTVPAHGTAAVRVMSNTAHAGPDGGYHGRVIAQPTNRDSGEVATPVGTSIRVGKEAESYTLTVEHLDPAGKLTGKGMSQLFGLDVDVRQDLYEADGTVRVRLPKGDYLLVGDVVDADDPNSPWHRLVQPKLRLDKDTTVRVDASTTKPVTTTVEQKVAQPALVELGVDRRAGGKSFISSLRMPDFRGVRTAQIGTGVSAEEMTSYLASTWAVPGGDGEFKNTPVTYGLLNTAQGEYFTGFQRAVADRELAKVVTQHNAQREGRGATKAFFAFAPGVTGTSGLLLPYDLPSRVTHYLEGGVAVWSAAFGESGRDQNGLPVDVTALGQPDRGYTAGQEYRERWNAAVFGPLFNFPGHVGRKGDLLWFGAPMYSDQDGHRGGSFLDQAATKVYRNGELVGEGAIGQLEVTVPPGEARFRVVRATERSSVSGFSRRIHASWEFTSDTASEEGVSLPLWMLRYAPDVDDRNNVKATPLTVLPVSVNPQPEGAVGQLREVTVSISGDEGKSWRPALPVPQGNSRFLAIALTPHGAKNISLRSRVRDSDGNVFDLTIISAYHLSR